MKSLKILFLSALVATAGLFTACTEDNDWSAGAPAEGPQVYFSADAQTSYTVGKNDSKIEIPVLRIETAGAIDVPVLVTVAEENTGLFTIPSSVAFADASANATLTIGFDYATLTPGSTYNVGLTLDDPTMTTPYGNSQLKLSIAVPEPYVLLGVGLYRDDLIPNIFNIGGNPEYPVEVYENTNNPGFIYMKNPYSNAKGVYPVKASNFHSFEEDVYFAIDVRNPDAVVVPEQPLGLTVDDYGDVWVRMYGDNVGTLKNKIITFGPETMEQAMTLYKGGSYDYLWGSKNGLFRLALPGAVLTDFSLEVEYVGHVADLAGNAAPVVNVAGGADVAGVAVEFIAGDMTADYASVVAEMAGQSIEDLNYAALETYEDEEGNEIHDCIVEGGDPMPAGQVTAVVLPYDANGVAQTESAVAVVFYFPGCGAEVPECNIDAFLGWFSEVYGPGYEAQYPDATTMAMVIVGEDIVAAKYGLVTGLSLTQDLEGEDAYGVLEYVESQIGSVMYELPEQYMSKINSENGMASYFDELPEGYPCVLFVEGENSYGQKKMVARSKEPATTPAAQAMLSLKSLQYNGVKTAVRIPLR